MSKRGPNRTSSATPSASPVVLPAGRFTSLGQRLLLILASVVCLSLAFAPFNQFYLAWIGLVPWLLLIAGSKSRKAVFWWSWLAGYLFFGVSMWWLACVTLPGAAALVLYLGLYFPVIGLIIRGSGLLRDISPESADFSLNDKIGRQLSALLLIPAIWIGFEWIRGNLFTGLPWLYLGHTQTPALVMCQIADLASAYGVGFWVVMLNVLITLAILNRFSFRKLFAPIALTSVTIACVLAYGLFRMSQQTTAPGPTILLIQPNVPQDNSGAKGADFNVLTDFHLTYTQAALQKLKEQNKAIDLVVWSETMMPFMGDERFFKLTRGTIVYTDKAGEEYDYLAVRSLELKLAKQFNADILVGAVTIVPRVDSKGELITTANRNVALDRFNSAHLIPRTGLPSGLRYDKSHLVPFGEFIPFKDSIPLLYKFFNLFNPYSADANTLVPGTSVTLFPLESAVGKFKFVTPICFEDVDSALVARMFRPDSGSAKRADLIVNLTNDGWFRVNQMPQHLQIAAFRSIENRVPTARSVNTGISAFIDPLGRIYGELPRSQVGQSAQQLIVDSRTTFYTLYGNVFAWICLFITALLTVLNIARAWSARKNRKKLAAMGR